MTVRGAVDVPWFLMGGYDILSGLTEISEEHEAEIVDATPIGLGTRYQDVIAAFRLASSGVVYWRMDDATGPLKDYGMGAFGATGIGSPTYRLTGGAISDDGNCAITLNGTTAYFKAAAAAGRFNTGDCSVEFWIRAATPAGTRTIIACGQAAANEWAVQLLADGTIRWYVDALTLNPATVVGDSKWHYVVCTANFDLNTGDYFRTVYVDGVAVGVASTTAWNVNAGGSVYIGTDVSLGAFLAADLDEIALYPAPFADFGALTAAMVAAHYAAGRTAPHWRRYAWTGRRSWQIGLRGFWDDAAGKAIDRLTTTGHLEYGPAGGGTGGPDITIGSAIGGRTSDVSVSGPGAERVFAYSDDGASGFIGGRAVIASVTRQMGRGGLSKIAATFRPGTGYRGSTVVGAAGIGDADGGGLLIGRTICPLARYDNNASGRPPIIDLGSTYGRARLIVQITSGDWPTSAGQTILVRSWTSAPVSSGTATGGLAGSLSFAVHRASLPAAYEFETSNLRRYVMVDPSSSLIGATGSIRMWAGAARY